MLLFLQANQRWYKIDVKKDFGDEGKHFLEILKLSALILKQKYKFTDSDIIRFLSPNLEIKEEKEQITIPIEIFSKRLGILESVIKYLKENKNFRNNEISILLKRSEKTVWSSYNSSLKKHPSKFKNIKDSKIKIPLNIFSDNKIGNLEALVLYLYKIGFSINEISNLLDRKYKTIYSTLNNALNKTKNKNERKK
ncbi:MAG: hypothetical protein QXU20_01290 [Candidatus Woesearchaeota archaeon]